MLERLAGLTPAGRAATSDAEALDDLRFARTCYDHLAGWLGVALRNALVARKVLVVEGAEHRVTEGGGEWLRRFGVDLDGARQLRRSFARACLDWSERRHHLAGALGQALFDRLVARSWLERRPGERAVDLTPGGRRGISKELGVFFAPRGP